MFSLSNNQLPTVFRSYCKKPTHRYETRFLLDLIKQSNSEELHEIFQQTIKKPINQNGCGGGGYEFKQYVRSLTVGIKTCPP